MFFFVLFYRGILLRRDLDSELSRREFLGVADDDDLEARAYVSFFLI